MKAPRRGSILLLLPVFAGVFWLTAQLAAALPGLFELGVDVHSLRLANYAGDVRVALAPLSPRIIGDVDRTSGPAANGPTSAPAAPGPTSRATPVPTGSPSPRPSPRPTPTPLPSILPTPTPLPSVPPTPTPLPSVPPTPSPFPLPIPSPLPSPLPLPAPSGLPILPSLFPGIFK